MPRALTPRAAATPTCCAPSSFTAMRRSTFMDERWKFVYSFWSLHPHNENRGGPWGPLRAMGEKIQKRAKHS